MKKKENKGNKKLGKIILYSAMVALIACLAIVLFVFTDVFEGISFAKEDNKIILVADYRTMEDEAGVAQTDFLTFDVKPYIGNTLNEVFHYTIWLEKKGTSNEELYLNLTSSKKNEVGIYYGNVKCYDYLDGKYLDSIYYLNDAVTDVICNYDLNTTTKIYGESFTAYNYSALEYGNLYNTNNLECNYTNYVWSDVLNRYVTYGNDNGTTDKSYCRYGVVYGNPTILTYSSLDKEKTGKVMLLEGNIIYVNGVDIDNLDGIRTYELRYWTRNAATDVNYEIKIDIETVD